MQKLRQKEKESEVKLGLRDPVTLKKVKHDQPMQLTMPTALKRSHAETDIIDLTNSTPEPTHKKPQAACTPYSDPVYWDILNRAAKCFSFIYATNGPSWVNLQDASQAMKKYKGLVDVTGGEMDDSIKQLMKSLEDIWVALGYVCREDGSTYAAYVELHFPPQQEGVEEVTERLASAMSSEGEVNIDLLSRTEGSDIGVSEFANKSLDELLQLFGLELTWKIPFASDKLVI
ncbi:hypothetical protein FRC11_004465 [Ceratobasidium sp. 423]|nr:hypothetical protein FRC11_004465 [Ceratobasidium sp. 423]